MKAYIPLLGPVVMSSLTDAQERGMTLETRGFGIKGVKQTSYVEVTKSKLDKVLRSLLIVFFVSVLLITVLNENKCDIKEGDKNGRSSIRSQRFFI